MGSSQWLSVESMDVHPSRTTGTLAHCTVGSRKWRSATTTTTRSTINTLTRGERAIQAIIFINNCKIASNSINYIRSHLDKVLDILFRHPTIIYGFPKIARGGFKSLIWCSQAFLSIAFLNNTEIRYNVIVGADLDCDFGPKPTNFIPNRWTIASGTADPLVVIVKVCLSCIAVNWFIWSQFLSLNALVILWNLGV